MTVIEVCIRLVDGSNLRIGREKGMISQYCAFDGSCISENCISEWKGQVIYYQV